MLLTYEFLLLYIDNESGKFVGTMTGHGASMALLADLLREGRVSIAEEKLRVIDDSPTGEWILDEGLALIKTAKDDELKTVLRHMAAGWTPLRKRLVEEFVAKGVLREDERRILFIFPKACWPTANPSSEEATRSRLRRILIAHREPSTDDLALISAVRSCHLLEQFIPKENMEEAKERMRELTEDLPVYQAMKKIKDENAAAAAIAASVATTTAIIPTIIN